MDDAGLSVYTLENPGYPDLLNTVDTPGRVWKVAVSGSHAFVADGEAGLQIVRLE